MAIACKVFVSGLKTLRSNASRFPWAIQPRIHRVTTRRKILQSACVRGNAAFSPTYFAMANGIETPAINIKSGMTRSHARKPSQVACVQCAIYHAPFGWCPSHACMIGQSIVSTNKSKPRKASSDSRRCAGTTTEFSDVFSIKILCSPRFVPASPKTHSPSETKVREIFDFSFSRRALSPPSF